jgi:hypothetical protein
LATIIFKDAYLMVNTVDLSEYVKSVTLSYEAELQDDTTMGDNTRSNKAGLKNWSIDVEFVQDYAALKVDATLFPLVGAAPFAVILKPDGDTTSVTNPRYDSSAAVLENYQPMGGTVGDLAMSPVSIRPAKGGDLTRLTADP